MLLAVALIWGVGFVVNRLAALQVGALIYNGVRFTLGTLTLVPFVWQRLRSFSRLELWGGALVGLVLFAGSAFQQMGLRFTTAGKAAFITGLYVVLVPLLLALIWRQLPHWTAWAASTLAAVGLFLLSAVERMALSPGDSLELAGALMWAFHVIIIGRLAQRVDAMRFALAQYAVCGLVSILAGLALEEHTWRGLAAAWWAVVFTGVLSVGLAYTLQVMGQRHAPPTDAAVILSAETVFAAFSGWLVLGETLAAQQWVGCGLMLGGMILAQVRSSILKE